MKAVLTFHSIDDTGSVLSYPIEKFRRLISALVESSTPVVSIDDLSTVSDGVVLSFDDGMSTVCKYALPILKNAGLPAHLFLTTGAVGCDNRWPTQPADAETFSMMSWEEIDNCINGGMIVDAHTNTHPFLTRCSDQQIKDECEEANSIIFRYTGRQPTAFAYPYGDQDSRVVEVIRSIYDYGMTTSLDFVGTTYEPHLIPRLDSFYLQHPLFARNLFSRETRFYIGIRRLLRRFRGRD